MKYKILGFSFIGLVILAAISLVYYREVKNSFTPYEYPIHKQNDIKTYSDVEGNFEFQYPKQFSIVPTNSESDQNYFPSPNEKQIVKVSVPSSVYVGTNFADSSIEIAEDGSVKNAADCKKYSNGSSNIQQTNKTETVNGMVFDKAEFSDAGAGNFYDTRLYRIFHDSICYEVGLTLHTTNIANYPPGTVVEVNKNEAWSKMVLVLNTFKFTDTAAINQNAYQTPSNSYPTPATGTGRLTGHFDVGPLCPVVQVGKACGSADYSKTKVLIYQGNKLIKTVDVDSSGNYSVDLVAGNYNVSYQTNYGFPGIRPMQSLVVKATVVENLNFNIDTGIR